jgi:hypothetical protein
LGEAESEVIIPDDWIQSDRNRRGVWKCFLFASRHIKRLVTVLNNLSSIDRNGAWQAIESQEQILFGNVPNLDQSHGCNRKFFAWIDKSSTFLFTWHTTGIFRVDSPTA